MNRTDTAYLKLLSRILTEGFDMPDRTGTGRRSLFGEQLKFEEIGKQFPILTTKRIWFKGVMEELFWFLRGEDTIISLQDAGVHFWDEWADTQWGVGPVYGVQWRSWPIHGEKIGIDQIATVLSQIKANPWSRRLIVSAWNVADLPMMALPPCHMFMQFQVTPGSRCFREKTSEPKLLNCHMYMRSADVFLGVPFNIASYALLTCMMAKVARLTPNDLTISFGDVHIYHNHFAQVNTQLARTGFMLPKLELTPLSDIDAFKAEDVVLIDYLSHPPIKAPIAV